MATLEANPGLMSQLLQRQGLRQFIKFCLVGALSTAVNLGVLYLLVELLHILQYFQSEHVGRAVALTIAFVVSVVNGYFWNSKWTFRQSDAAGERRRIFQFTVTNLVGLCLNVLIATTVAHRTPGILLQALSPYLKRDPGVFVGTIAATVIVVFWNFTVNKYWTFRS
jgi:putative flippase GtrA